MAALLHPEVDDSSFLDEGGNHKFKSMIGCANWLIDIIYSVNSFSRHSMAQRHGYLNGIMKVVGYLKNH